MVTQTSNKLSHEEALELLPWHVNATLEQPLAKLVARHVEHCETCRDESAILASAIVALNTDEESTANLDGRFNRLLGRVREYERNEQSASREPTATLGQRLTDWLGFSQSRLQWAGTFALGLAVGVVTILVASQPAEVVPDSPSDYEVHATPQSAPLRLLVEFDGLPAADLLAQLEDETGTARWQRHSDTQYLINLSGETTVNTVKTIQGRLLAYDAVEAVTIDIGNNGHTPN